MSDGFGHRVRVRAILRGIVGLLCASLLAFPVHAERDEALDKIKGHAEKLQELVKKYREAKIPIIKHESVSIHDRRGNPQNCSLRIWYNNGTKVDLATSGGKYEGNFDHGEKPVSKAISLRLSNCACTPVRTRHTQTWPALSEPLEKIKQVVADEIRGYAEDKAKEFAKSAFEKVAEGLGVGAKASGFLSGFTAGAEVGAAVGNHLTEQINKILDDAAAGDLVTAGDSAFPAHPNAGRLTARWWDVWRAKPRVSDRWDITVRCGRRIVPPSEANWHFVSDLTPKPPVTVTPGTGQDAADREEAARRKQEADGFRREQQERERKRKAERAKEEAEAKRKREERRRKLEASAAEIARTCTICDPIRTRIAEVEKDIADRERQLPGLEAALSAARAAGSRAQRAERAARDRLARFRNPTSSVTDHTTGRTVTSTDLEVRNQAAREIWNRRAAGELSADETTAEWARLDDPAVRAGIKQRAEQRLEAEVDKATQAREAADRAVREAELALTRARGALRGWRRMLTDLRAQLAECVKQCKANAMKIARGWYQAYYELPNVNSLYAPARPKVQVRVLNVTHVSGNNPFDARDPAGTGESDASGSTAAAAGGGANPLAASASPPSYVGNSNCGVVTTNFDIVSSSVVALDPLGANGRTRFDVDPGTGNANSQSSNLTIIGDPGHSCQLFGIGANAFTLFCFRTGASCSEAFSR